MTSRRDYFNELIMLVRGPAGAAAHLIQALRQTLGLMHFKVQQHRLWIGGFPIDQLIPGRMPTIRGTELHKATRRDMRRSLANVCAYADTINRHRSKLNTAEMLKLAEVTICN
jgi:hypothetical protein